MSYCMNPQCQHPQNSPGQKTCKSCGASLHLKDRYRMVRILGESANSRTFLAVDEDKPSKPQCTIKQFIGSPENIDSRTGEIDCYKPIEVDLRCRARELERIGHNALIPELWASFEENGSKYFVHEYIRGRNLADELASDGVFGEIQIWELLTSVLPVLEVVHDNGIVHGDIKPENIVRSPQYDGSGGNRLSLVDFGSAIPLVEVEQYPGERMMGAAEYVAPEQTQGHFDGRNDLYSLGVTCLHLMTDVSPFELFDVKSNTWVWRDYIKRPVSRRLGRILDKLVERNPARRYQSASEAIAALKRGPTAGAFAESSDQQWILTAWGGIALTILSLILASRLPTRVPETPSRPEIPVRRMPEVRPNYNRNRPNNYRRGYQNRQSSGVRTLRSGDGPIWSLAITPDGQLVASGQTDGSINLVDIDTGTVVNTLSGHNQPVGTIAIAPEGRFLASAGGDGTIRIWDLWNSRLVRVLPGHRSWVHALAFSPDGASLASAGGDGSIRLWNVDTGFEERTLRGYGEQIQAIVFSANGEMLISGSSNGLLELWDRETGQLRRSLAAHPQAIWSLAVSPDGQTLATGSWDRTVRLWDLNRLELEYFTSLPLQTLTGHGDKIQSLSFSPDGQTLASGDFDGTIKLWPIEPGGLTGTMKGHQHWVNVVFNPVETTLVSGSFDNSIKVWPMGW
ncbi:serine/threonine protein kinase [Arthrospira platensis FACHB-971]|nr:serine/threonine-protein kinase [Arthrospira platensis]KDR58974.1 serine/threonine protein kinase [Arthrospira platensis str. Paraca]MBD2575683.1 serine/threonine protein kinase [Arthrospira platensis FACHB-971]MBD2671901.1 serine/threonine protein kinase [Arthrospira platensis FACHB-439]MBD2712939.1 serine/threonine protein kinase [Arthrospira platensis FACHB-835]MDT9313127.1 serine/threonine protein kinase [Limnospira sp. Paracas R14]BAI93121.1 serine/threonine protein kinase with WD-40 